MITKVDMSLVEGSCDATVARTVDARRSCEKPFTEAFYRGVAIRKHQRDEERMKRPRCNLLEIELVSLHFDVQTSLSLNLKLNLESGPTLVRAAQC